MAQAGVLEKGSYTVTFTREQLHFLGCFNESGFCYQPVVENGNVITAQGHAFVEFGIRVGERLGTVKDIEKVRSFYQGKRNVLTEDGS